MNDCAAPYGMVLSRRASFATPPTCDPLVCNRRACYKYTVWCSGAKELYDLSVDAYEVDNRWADGVRGASQLLYARCRTLRSTARVRWATVRQPLAAPFVMCATIECLWTQSPP